MAAPAPTMRVRGDTAELARVRRRVGAWAAAAGLGVFMAYVEPAREAGGDLKIAALPERVFEVFDLLGFPTVFDMHETVEGAVDTFEGA